MHGIRRTVDNGLRRPTGGEFILTQQEIQFLVAVRHNHINGGVTKSESHLRARLKKMGYVRKVERMNWCLTQKGADYLANHASHYIKENEREENGSV